MKHFICIFDIETEELLEQIEIPEHRKNELSSLMDWKTPEDEIYVYDLTAEHLKKLETWIGKSVNSPHHIVQLTSFAD